MKLFSLTSVFDSPLCLHPPPQPSLQANGFPILFPPITYFCHFCHSHAHRLFSLHLQLYSSTLLMTVSLWLSMTTAMMMMMMMKNILNFYLAESFCLNLSSRFFLVYLSVFSLSSPSLPVYPFSFPPSLSPALRRSSQQCRCAFFDFVTRD